MEYERYFLISTIIGTDTFIVLLFQDILSPYTQLCSKHPKLPSKEWIPITRGFAIRNIELQTRKIETYGLTDGFDVGLFEGKKYA